MQLSLEYFAHFLPHFQGHVMAFKDNLVLFQQLPPKAIVTQQTSPLNIESHIVTRTHTDIHRPTITALPRSAQELSEVKKNNHWKCRRRPCIVGIFCIILIN